MWKGHGGVVHGHLLLSVGWAVPELPRAAVVPAQGWTSCFMLSKAALGLLCRPVCVPALGDV